MISLADLRARNITPVWQEAVAVVQELIHTVRATSGSAELLPDLEHIALIPNGDVVAMPGSPGPDHPVRHAAVMLKLLLDNTPVPPELDAFVQRNIADPPQFDSVAEFSRNLAFFERPGRRSDVERLVGRAMAVEVQRRADRELELLKARAVEVTKTEDHTVTGTERIPRSGRRTAIAAAALLVIVLAATAALYLSGVGGDEEIPAVQDVVADASTESTATQPVDLAGGVEASSEEAVATEPREAQEPVSEPASRGGSLLASTADALSDVVGVAVRTITGRRETVVRPAPEPPPAPTARAARTARTSARPAGATGSSQARNGEATVPTIVEVPRSSEVAPSPAAPEASPIENFDLSPAPSLVYSAKDDEVLPPVLVRPVLPTEPPPNVPPEQVGTIEVVVDEQGDVVNVKLISPANRFHERMLVSAAKMWKFRPAYKDGHPVRYRTRVRLTI